MAEKERMVAFLRGINLGNRRLTNERLVEVVAEAGLEGVAAYQAAGNVVFDDPGREPDEVAAELESHFRDALGYEVHTFVRRLGELKELVAWAEPIQDAAEAGFKAHVLFLREAAAEAGERERLDALETPDDRFHVHGREILWLRRGGMANADIPTVGAGGIAGGETGTARTLGTVRRIAKKFGSAADG